jgi:hypothetical protein
VEKQARYDSHLSFLSKCSTHGRIPDGLRIKLPIELDVSSKHLERCNRIRRDASLKIVDILIEGVGEKCSNIKDETVLCREALRKSDAHLYAVAADKTESWGTSMRTSCERVKKSKWEQLVNHRKDTTRPENNDSQQHVSWFDVDGRDTEVGRGAGFHGGAVADPGE